MLNQAKLALTSSTGPPPLNGLAISAKRTTSVAYSQTSRHISEWMGLGLVVLGWVWLVWVSFWDAIFSAFRECWKISFLTLSIHYTIETRVIILVY
jgi:hypothetical protein